MEGVSIDTELNFEHEHNKDLFFFITLLTSFTKLRILLLSFDLTIFFNPLFKGDLKTFLKHCTVLFLLF